VVARRSRRLPRALEAWLRASPSGQFDALAGKAWQGFAEVLLAARVYE
jgi:hypothetical protein